MRRGKGRTMEGKPGWRTDIINVVSALLSSLVIVVACGCSGSSGNSGQPSGPSSSQSAAPFALSLPIAPGDSTSALYGIWPFGVHGSSHLLDGHPGFDFEYRPGAPVYAPTDATVSGRMADQNSPSDREVLQLRYPGVPMDHLIDITNLMNVPASLQKDARVTRGQVIGTAGPIGFGAGPFTSAMIHFQVSDPNHTEANIAPHQVSPDKFMTAEAKAQLDVIWQTAVYVSEWCEPFLDNDRAALFPKSRTSTIGTATSGQAPAAQIVAGCPTQYGTTEYTLLDANGATMETGSMVGGWAARPPTVDFVPASGSRRLGIYDIVGDTMRLALGAPGAGRPTSFANASTYTTR